MVNLFNLRHLRNNCKDSEFKRWYQSYRISQKQHKLAKIDQNTLTLIKFIISSNSAMAILENDYLRELLEPKVKVMSYNVLRYTFLPNLLEKLKILIEEKLVQCEYFSLITDIWTNLVMADFIGLAMSLTNKFFEREIIVVDLSRMPGPHNAEFIKKAILDMDYQI